jgi:hypothetical protein
MEQTEKQLDGLWTAEFGSSVGVSGGGVAVFQDGRVLGGDDAYFYVGTYNLTGTSFKAVLRVSPFIEGAESLFRTRGIDLTLELNGELTSDVEGIAQGFPREMPSLKIGVKLTKRQMR